MAFTHTVTKTVVAPEGATSQSNSYTASNATAVDESVSANQTNYQINVAIDVSEIESLYIVADQACTLKTNSTSAPDNTISLLAGVPLEWQSNSYYSCPLTADVTKVYITNTTALSFTLRVLQDSTP